MHNFIFDFGQVLVEFNPHRLYDSVFGGDIEKAEWFHQNITTPDFYDNIDRGDEFAKCIRDLQDKHPDYAEERGYGLYGLTNWSYKVYAVMERVPIFRLLDGCVISSEEHLIKPDLRIYQRLVDKFKLQPSDCLFVDDKQTNVDAAKASGMHSLLFTGSCQLRDDLSKLGVF